MAAKNKMKMKIINLITVFSFLWTNCVFAAGGMINCNTLAARSALSEVLPQFRGRYEQGISSRMGASVRPKSHLFPRYIHIEIGNRLQELHHDDSSVWPFERVRNVFTRGAAYYEKINQGELPDYLSRIEAKGVVIDRGAVSVIRDVLNRILEPQKQLEDSDVEKVLLRHEELEKEIARKQVDFVSLLDRLRDYYRSKDYPANREIGRIMKWFKNNYNYAEEIVQTEILREMMVHLIVEGEVFGQPLRVLPDSYEESRRARLLKRDIPGEIALIFIKLARENDLIDSEQFKHIRKVYLKATEAWHAYSRFGGGDETFADEEGQFEGVLSGELKTEKIEGAGPVMEHEKIRDLRSLSDEQRRAYAERGRRLKISPTMMVGGDASRMKVRTLPDDPDYVDFFSSLNREEIKNMLAKAQVPAVCIGGKSFTFMELFMLQCRNQGVSPRFMTGINTNDPIEWYLKYKTHFGIKPEDVSAFVQNGAFSRVPSVAMIEQSSYARDAKDARKILEFPGGVDAQKKKEHTAKVNLYEEILAYAKEHEGEVARGPDGEPLLYVQNHFDLIRYLFLTMDILDLYESGVDAIYVTNVDNTVSNIDEDFWVMAGIFDEMGVDALMEVAKRPEGQKGGSLLQKEGKLMGVEDPMLSDEIDSGVVPWSNTNTFFLKTLGLAEYVGLEESDLKRLLDLKREGKKDKVWQEIFGKVKEATSKISPMVNIKVETRKTEEGEEVHIPVVKIERALIQATAPNTDGRQLSLGAVVVGSVKDYNDKDERLDELLQGAGIKVSEYVRLLDKLAARTRFAPVKEPSDLNVNRNLNERKLGAVLADIVACGEIYREIQNPAIRAQLDQLFVLLEDVRNKSKILFIDMDVYFNANGVTDIKDKVHELLRQQECEAKFIVPFSYDDVSYYEFKYNGFTLKVQFNPKNALRSISAQSLVKEFGEIEETVLAASEKAKALRDSIFESVKTPELIDRVKEAVEKIYREIKTVSDGMKRIAADKDRRRVDFMDIHQGEKGCNLCPEFQVQIKKGFHCGRYAVYGNIYSYVDGLLTIVGEEHKMQDIDEQDILEMMGFAEDADYKVAFSHTGAGTSMSQHRHFRAFPIGKVLPIETADTDEILTYGNDENRVTVSEVDRAFPANALVISGKKKENVSEYAYVIIKNWLDKKDIRYNLLMKREDDIYKVILIPRANIETPGNFFSRFAIYEMCGEIVSIEKDLDSFLEKYYLPEDVYQEQIVDGIKAASLADGVFDELKLWLERTQCEVLPLIEGYFATNRAAEVKDAYLGAGHDGRRLIVNKCRSLLTEEGTQYEDSEVYDRRWSSRWVLSEIIGIDFQNMFRLSGDYEEKLGRVLQFYLHSNEEKRNLIEEMIDSCLLEIQYSPISWNAKRMYKKVAEIVDMEPEDVRGRVSLLLGENKSIKVLRDYMASDGHREAILRELFGVLVKEGRDLHNTRLRNFARWVLGEIVGERIQDCMAYQDKASDVVEFYLNRATQEQKRIVESIVISCLLEKPDSNLYRAAVYIAGEIGVEIEISSGSSHVEQRANAGLGFKLMDTSI